MTSSTRKPNRSAFFEDPEQIQSEPEGGATDAPPGPAPVAATQQPVNQPSSDNPDLRLLLDALKAARDGNLTVRLPEGNGLGEIATVFNDLVSLNQGLTNEFSRISQVVGDTGQLTERATLTGAKGAPGRPQSLPVWLCAALFPL